MSKTFYINLKLFTWGLFFSKTSSPCPSAVCTCPLPLVGQGRLSLTFSFAYSLANAEINSLATIFLPI